jgi:hypothetical protein
MNALFVGGSEGDWWHLSSRLKQMGCNSWFAGTTEEVRVLLGQRPFCLVLSTRPVTERGPLMELLCGPGRWVFYSFPIENGCLWFQAVPHVLHGPRASSLRPSEFMSIVSQIVLSEGHALQDGCQISD